LVGGEDVKEDYDAIIKGTIESWKRINSFIYPEINKLVKNNNNKRNNNFNNTHTIIKINLNDVVMRKIEINEKLSIKWVGPLLVKEINSDKTLELSVNNGEIIYNRVPVSQIKKTKKKFSDVISKKEFEIMVGMKDREIEETHIDLPVNDNYQRRTGLRDIPRKNYLKVARGECGQVMVFWNHIKKNLKLKILIIK
jgi:hypothetical protein